jgi:hypothetical protein
VQRFRPCNRLAVDHDVEQLVGQPIEHHDAFLAEREHVLEFHVYPAELDREAHVDILEEIETAGVDGHVQIPFLL